MNERLRGVRVTDMITRKCQVVDGNINLQTLVNEHLSRRQRLRRGRGTCRLFGRDCEAGKRSCVGSARGVT